MNMKTITIGKSKLALLGTVLFLSSFFFGGQADAVGPVMWTGSSSNGLVSDMGNWSAPYDQTNSLLFTSTADTIVFDASTTVAGIGLSQSFTGTVSFASGVEVTSTGNVTVTVGALNISTDNILNVGGNLGVSSTINMNGGAVNVAGNITVTSTLTTLGGTVKMTGASKTIGGPGSLTFSNLTFDTGASVSLTGNVTSTTYLTVNSGATLTASGYNINAYLFVLAGSLIQSGSGSVNIISDGGYISGDGEALIYNFTAAANCLLGSSSTIANILTVNGGKTLTGGSRNINLTTSGIPFVLNGSFVKGSSTFIYSGDNTQIASTTYFNLTINSTSTLTGSTTVSNVLTINSGKTLNAGTAILTLSGTGTPFVVNGTFNRNTSTVVYSGVGLTYISPTSSYYNLTINSTGANVTTLTDTIYVYNVCTLNGSFYGASNNLYLYGSDITPFVNNGTFDPGYGRVTYAGTSSTVSTGTYFNLSIAAAGVVLGGNVTTTNVLQINSTQSLNAGNNTVRLSGPYGDTGAPFVNGGTFTASTSEFIFSNTGTVIVTGTSYYKLSLGSGTYTLGGNVTTTNTFTNNGSLTLDTYSLVASGDYLNNGIVSGISYAKKQAIGAGLNSSSYTSGSSNGTGNSVVITVYDPTANSNGSTAQTITVTLAASNYSDSETVTLTEDGVASGNFVGTIPFYITNSNSTAPNRLDVSGNGTLTLTNYSNGYGDASLSTLSASYSGSTYSSGGGTGGGGSAPSVSSAVSAATVSAGGQTTSQNITLNLSATNATQVAISEDPGFAGASWDTYAPTKPFTLSKGAGEKTIYVKFRSASGGVTSAYKVNVTLKDGYIAAPVATATNVATPVSIVTAPHFEVANPDSKVVIVPLKTLVYKPNSTLKYTYSYKNETTKTAKVKVVRQVLDANGKAVAKATGSTSIAKGKTFKTNVTNVLNSKLADGTYTVKVQIMDFKTGKLLEENSFDIAVKKPAPVVKKPVVKAPVVKKK